MDIKRPLKGPEEKLTAVQTRGSRKSKDLETGFESGDPSPRAECSLISLPTRRALGEEPYLLMVVQGSPCVGRSTQRQPCPRHLVVSVGYTH